MIDCAKVAIDPQVVYPDDRGGFSVSARLGDMKDGPIDYIGCLSGI